MQAAALNEARPVESVNEWLAGVQVQADAVAGKFARAAADLKREQLAEATKHRDHYSNLAAETKAMAAERETFQGREATMAAAMRYKAQALVWEREVCSLTAQLAAPVVQAAVELPTDAVAGMDDMCGVAA
ncbi:MAG: hypothetical protein EOP35_01685 [Rubrivivax sp.]|nr:MAG: hypothetical protein EOP35_01685 [Rubrivivax sp.]